MRYFAATMIVLLIACEARPLNKQVQWDSVFATIPKKSKHANALENGK